MREIKLFFKYGLFFQTRASKKKFGRRWGTLLGQIIIFVYFFLFVFLILFFPFKKMAGIEYQLVNFLDLTASYWNLMAGLFFLVGTIGAAVYMLSLNEEVEFLLSLPLRRWSVVMYQVVMSFFHDLAAFGMILGVVFAYGLALGSIQALLAVISAVVYSLMLLSIGIFMSVFFSKWLKGQTARKFFILLQSVAIVGMILVINMNLNNMTSGSKNPQEVFAKLASLQNFFESPFNLFSYAILGVKNPVFILLSLAVAALFFYLFVQVSQNFSFSVIRRTRKRAASIKRSSKTIAVIRKEVRAIMQQDNALFLLLYPYVFGGFMAITSWKTVNPGSALMLSLPISVLYVFIMSAQATVADVADWELTKSLPLDLLGYLRYKVAAPVVLHFFPVLAMIVAGILKGGWTEDCYWLVPSLLGASVFLQVLSSLIGVAGVFITPPKTENVPKESIRGPLWRMYLTMGLSFGVTFSLSTIKDFWWSGLIFAGTVAISVYLMIYFSRAIKKHYLKLMRGF